MRIVGPGGDDWGGGWWGGVASAGGDKLPAHRVGRRCWTIGGGGGVGKGCEGGMRSRRRGGLRWVAELG